MWSHIGHRQRLQTCLSCSALFFGNILADERLAYRHQPGGIFLGHAPHGLDHLANKRVIVIRPRRRSSSPSHDRGNSIFSPAGADPSNSTLRI